MIIMGSRCLTSPSPTCTACGSTSRGQVCHTEASWRCTPFTGDTHSSLRHTGRCARSAHRASGYQLAAICYSWCGDINKLEPSQQQRLIMYQDNNQTTKTATCATTFLTARRSVSFAQGSGHQPSAWTGELPLTIRSGFFFLLYAAWVRSRAERPSVSYTKVVMEVAWTGHNLQFTKTN